MNRQAEPAAATAAVPAAEKLPAAKPAEKTPDERLTALAGALKTKASARRSMMDRIASLAAESQDKAFRDRCAQAVGDFLSADGTSTTEREYAAKTLGAVNSPKAVQCLRDALSDGKEGEKKYPTTVRTAAVRALINYITMPMTDGAAREDAMKIVRSVAAGDKYDPKKEAERYLARLQDIGKKNAGT